MAKKLLVIDDEKSITTIIEKIASHLGFEVETVNHPALASAVVQSFQPDVLLLDLIMPDLDGIDIMRELMAGGTSTRIILMTGYGAGYMRLGQAVAEFHDHPSIETLAKPFRRADLVALLCKDQGSLPDKLPDVASFPAEYGLDAIGRRAAA